MDLDEELEMLQRELMAVQEEKANPLSERTVAEIMIKLQQQGFKFYATTDGNEYITPAQLDHEITRFVQERGRAKIGILPPILNLNHDLIESRINPICNSSTHVRNGGTIYSADYLKSVVISIKQKLETEGIVDIDEVALSQEFNMQFLMNLIENNLAELDAEIVGMQLITKEYTRMKKRKMLGYLLAVGRPISMDSFMKSVKVSDPNPEKLIDELISSGKLKGKCHNSFYIPDRFSKNQQQVIQNFFENNGYLEFSMLQKNYLVPKPEEWIRKNLRGTYVVFEGVCFRQSKLEQYQAQLQSLLKGDGFVQISTVVPFDLDGKKMEKFLTESCALQSFRLHDGICFSEQWIERCVNEFRDRVIFDLFFRRAERGNKKKGGKKDSNAITENELVEALFDAGLAEYSVAEDLAESLLPVLLERLELLKVQCQKQLTQSQGVISSSFLKYRKCKSIFKTEENLQRTLNIIEKNKKKTGNWVDIDFGPAENDEFGKYSLIYYDGIAPKDWPELTEIKWVEVPLKQIMTSQQVKSKFLNKSMVHDFLRVLDIFNKSHKGCKIPTPYYQSKEKGYTGKMGEDEEFPTPIVFKFHISEKEKRFVLIDCRMPFANERPFASSGLYSLAEKAYAKLRYCYKGILSISIQQMILELTGLICQKLTFESLKDEELLLKELYCKYLQSETMVIAVGEGPADKKLKMADVDVDFYPMKPYLLLPAQPNTVIVHPENVELPLESIGKIFKNIYLLTPPRLM